MGKNAAERSAKLQEKLREKVQEKSFDLIRDLDTSGFSEAGRFFAQDSDVVVDLTKGEDAPTAKAEQLRDIIPILMTDVLECRRMYNSTGDVTVRTVFCCALRIMEARILDTQICRGHVMLDPDFKGYVKIARMMASLRISLLGFAKKKLAGDSLLEVENSDPSGARNVILQELRICNAAHELIDREDRRPVLEDAKQWTARWTIILRALAPAMIVMKDFDVPVVCSRLDDFGAHSPFNSVIVLPSLKFTDELPFMPHFEDMVSYCQTLTL
jgi:hypothetical protein